MKKLGEKAGVLQEMTQLPTEDWVQVKLEGDYQPYARVLKGGRYMAIPKGKNIASVYDIEKKYWVKDMPDFKWLAYEKPLHDSAQKYDVIMVDNVRGLFIESSREPEIGTFTPLGSGNVQTLYYSSSFLKTLLNTKEVYNEQGKRVMLKYLPENE